MLIRGQAVALFLGYQYISVTLSKNKMFIFRRYSSFPKLPKCEFTPEKYQGPSLEKIKSIRKTHINPIITTYYGKPLAIHQGYKQWLFDLEGKRYLDMFGGICTVSVGHSHPRITEAVNEQMKTLVHCSNVYLHPQIHQYSEKLAAKLPNNLKVIYFVNSGSEANDLAILMARCHTKKQEIMSLKNCYHGMTYQTMALTCSGHYRYPVVQNPGFLRTMNPDVYKGLWGGNCCRDSPVQADRSCDCTNECEAGINYLKQFENDITYEAPKTGIAAFFAESIQGVGGTVQFPKNYIKGVKEKVNSMGGLFVADEVQTGFGRTGEHFWGFQSHGIEPDIVTMAKGIGNGFPLAAVATSPEIAQSLTKATHFNTFGGNPVSCVVGSTVLDIIEDENLQENAHNLGSYLLLELKKLKEESLYIGDVRGKGLMIGVEFVSDRVTKEPLSSEKIMKVWEGCLDYGLIVGKGGINGNVFRIKPPMCITKEDADFTVEVLRQTLKTI
ncbi:alanine--glyoxylate aminotransferase 2, mitochondrial [Anthonomus grandis grandis]|uniref:alanine--glyoxylate aminotransferase 2, mitochondrial n=1 Tax=Anthonomus grandis grandis TaxID=2921223 RepID=UPI00216508EF|nr:alanine--glyoxylate aminotransferase 2, mitochondrial [Anthonomus grandis grandis]